ncbi:MAG TPA: ribosome biogenesis GTP-binding protein YihA/YsxC [Stellaceae bacterium]|nr:ribosome biogenesis GTP-binding protein YihA/YsxC [Stellaceae bacterium]
MGDLPAERRLSDPAEIAATLFPPRDLTPEAIEAGRRLFAREARFVAAAAEPAAIPPDGLPEIAFAGRSNVGKSSLINALCGRRMLARTSNTPGRTRTLNFFALSDRLVLVDLPGYGYAAAAKSAVAQWNRLLRHYLERRAALRRICLLIDARHGIKETDRPLFSLLDSCGAPYQIVLTKLDKLRDAEIDEVARRVTAELARHPAAHPEIHLTSAHDGQGLPALRAALGSFAETAAPSALAGPATRG